MVSERAKNFVSDPDSVFRILYYVVMGLYLINMIIKIIILILKYKKYYEVEDDL